MKSFRQEYKQQTVAFTPPVVVEKPKSAFQFKCLSCLNEAELIFEGSSYCQRCLKEKLRVGI